MSWVSNIRNWRKRYMLLIHILMSRSTWYIVVIVNECWVTHHWRWRYIPNSRWYINWAERNRAITLSEARGFGVGLGVCSRTKSSRTKSAVFSLIWCCYSGAEIVKNREKQKKMKKKANITSSESTFWMLLMSPNN